MAARGQQSSRISAWASSWAFGSDADHAESDKRVRTSWWAENTGSRADRARAVRARARKAQQRRGR